MPSQILKYDPKSRTEFELFLATELTSIADILQSSDVRGGKFVLFSCPLAVRGANPVASVRSRLQPPAVRILEKFLKLYIVLFKLMTLSVIID